MAQLTVSALFYEFGLNRMQLQNNYSKLSIRSGECKITSTLHFSYIMIS